MLRLFTYGARAVANKAAVLAFVALAAMAARAEPVEVVALGDSLTAGYGLMDHEGFVPQLRTWLEERGVEARIVNAGVSGDTTAGGLSRVDWSLSPLTEAMIVTLGGNDLLRGIDPANARDNLRGILEIAQERDLDVLLVGMEAPGNYGPDYKAEFDRMYADLAQEFGTLYFPRFFEGLLADGATPAELRDFMQADGIHPNGAGVARIVEAIGPSVAELIATAQGG